MMNQKNIPTRESYCRDCPAMPKSQLTPQLTQTITGCPNCSSIQKAFDNRTILDQKLGMFYMTHVLNNPKVDTNLLTLQFQY